MDPVFLTVYNFEIKWYSFLILVAVIIVYSFIARETKKFGYDKDDIFNMMFWAFVFGIIGARLYYCAFKYSEYISNPIEILKVWHGGLAIHGGLIGGFLGVLMYSKSKRFRLEKILDIICVPLLLGQAIGRWGNFFNQEAFGAPTTAAHLAQLHIPTFIINGMNIHGTTYTPTFFYESLACLICFIVLLFIRRAKYVKVGTMFSAYMIMYGAIRFFIEMSRTDALMIGPVKIAQVVSVALIVMGIINFMLSSRKSRFEDLYNDNKTNFKY